MNSIQLSFEIATSISIIGAALAFLWGQIGQSKKARILAVRQQRIEQMSVLIADFAALLDDGDLLIEKAANKSNTDHDWASEYICFSKRVERYIHIHSKLLFEVWANTAEKQVLADIKEHVEKQRMKFTQHNSQSHQQFECLVTAIGDNIKKLSSLLKVDVENIHK